MLASPLLVAVSRATIIVGTWRKITTGVLFAGIADLVAFLIDADMSWAAIGDAITRFTQPGRPSGQTDGTVIGDVAALAILGTILA
jgi:hypothetical protein